MDDMPIDAPAFDRIRLLQRRDSEGAERRGRIVAHVRNGLARRPPATENSVSGDARVQVEGSVMSHLVAGTDVDTLADLFAELNRRGTG